jgi:hypothetical protein
MYFIPKLSTIQEVDRLFIALCNMPTEKALMRGKTKKTPLDRGVSCYKLAVTNSGIKS